MILILIKKIAVFMILLFFILPQLVNSEDSFFSEQYVVEPFMGTLGGGPSSGPVGQCGDRPSRIIQDTSGNRYMVAGGNLKILDTNNFQQSIGPMGIIGFKDGPALYAQYNKKGYYGYWNMSCNKKGDVFIDDAGNSRIRRVYKTDNGEWITETWAGGGTTKLTTIGEEASPESVDIGNALISMVDCKGQVVIVAFWTEKIYRVSADGSNITLIAKIPVGFNAASTVDGDADTLGNVYFMNRTTKFIKVEPSGNTYIMAGLTSGLKNTDSKPLNTYFWMNTQMAASANGSCIYGNGGDEYWLRRIPTDTSLLVSSLAENGRFYTCVGGNETLDFDTTKLGSLPPVGSLRKYRICELAGKDRDGSLYIALYSWCGPSHRTPTTISKLKKVR